MHELNKQFLRPSSPSGSQKSSRYTFLGRKKYRLKHQTLQTVAANEIFILSNFLGPKILPDRRNQTNQIPQQDDPRAGKRKKDQELIQVRIHGMPHERPRSIGRGRGPTVPRTARTSSPGSLTRSSCPSPPTATRRRACPGPANTAPTSTILESR